MAKKTTGVVAPEAPASPAPAKPARASRKKVTAHQTHGALPPSSGMNMAKAFGLRDGYDVDTLDEYKAKIDDMTETDLHEHSHAMGIVPLEPRDKLMASLERKFVETKMSQRPVRQIHFKENPQMADFMKQFRAGFA